MKDKITKHLPTFVFVGFIGVMMILFIVLPKKEYSSSEKRYLADFPDTDISGIFNGKFESEFETYLSDHTAFRNFWVGLDSYYNLAIGNSCSNDIYHCKDGYLVNTPCDDTRLYDNIDIICNFAKGKEKKTVVLIAPSTGYIVSDLLPYNTIKYNDDAMFNKIINKFKKSNICFVDVRQKFKEEYNNGRQVYYKTDHHWTSLGAFDAYTTLSASMGYVPDDESEYQITSFDGFYGTTYSSSGYWLADPDTLEIWEYPYSNQTTVVIDDGDESKINQGMFFFEHLDEDDKYPVFLDGNHPYTIIKNRYQIQHGNNKKLLVIKDSFAHSLVPFLSEHYSEIHMVDLRYYKQSISDLIDSVGFSKILFVYSIDNLATDSDIAWLQ